MPFNCLIRCGMPDEVCKEMHLRCYYYNGIVCHVYADKGIILAHIVAAVVVVVRDNNLVKMCQGVFVCDDNCIYASFNVKMTLLCFMSENRTA